MTKQIDEISNPSRMSLWLGIIISVGYIGFILIYFHEKIFDLQSKQLNEIGDFLAGAFSPLAFLWLVVSLSLQRGELRQNTQALNLQLRELHQTVLHQGDIAEAAQFELDRERPHIRLNHLEFTASGTIPETFEYHLHLDIKNIGGPIKEAEMKLICNRLTLIDEYQDTLTKSLDHHCFRFTKEDNLNDLTYAPNLAALSISGLDVFNREYTKAFQFELDLLAIEESGVPMDNGRIKYPITKVSWEEITAEKSE